MWGFPALPAWRGSMPLQVLWPLSALPGELRRRGKVCRQVCQHGSASALPLVALRLTKEVRPFAGAANVTLILRHVSEAERSLSVQLLQTLVCGSLAAAGSPFTLCSGAPRNRCCCSPSSRGRCLCASGSSRRSLRVLSAWLGPATAFPPLALPGEELHGRAIRHRETWKDAFDVCPRAPRHACPAVP